MRSRTLVGLVLLLAGVGLLAALVVGATVGWVAALVVVLAIALGAASARLYLYLSLRDRFDALAHLANEAVIVLADDYRVVYASPSAEQIFGMAIHRKPRVDPASLVHEDDLSEVIRASKAARATPGGTFEITFRSANPRAGWRWVEASGVNLLHDPRVGGVVSTVRDVTDRVVAEQALRASSERFTELVSHSAEMLVLCDEHARATFASPAIAPGLGIHPDDLIGIDLLSLIHPADTELASAMFAQVVSEPGGAATFEVRALRADARYIEVEIRLQNLLDNDAVDSIVVHARDVTEAREAEREAARFQKIIESTPDIVVVSDASGRPLFLNQAARHAMGIPPHADPSAFDMASYLTEESRYRIQHDALPVATKDGAWNGELELRRPGDGTVFPVSHVLLVSRNHRDEVEFHASVSRDMTEQKELEAQLQHQADHDELTLLPSRKPLIAYLEVALANTRRFGGRVATLFLDVDHFKVVNDSLGHQAGDRLLVEFASRLRSAVRPQDRAGRFGGDEFVVVLPDVKGPKEAIEIAGRVRREVGGRFILGEEEVFVSASIGVALAVGAESPQELLRDADAAMYEAKAAGRDRVRLFDGAMRLHVVERLDIEQSLRRALDRDELCVHYQPLVELRTGRISGVEALVRWKHPQRGMLLPGQFLAVAEETGLIVDIGKVVLRNACARAASWVGVNGDSRSRPLPVFVNLSARQLADVNLVDDVRHVIDLTDVSPGAVNFEITEDALMVDTVATRRTLAQLRGLGVRLAIDDFGTGYSSLSYLKHFPVDALKIDRTFVEGLGSDAGDAAITAAIVEVAQRLGLSTVAEGIESADQAEWLSALGCDMGQGFHYARPMPGDELHDLLELEPV